MTHTAMKLNATPSSVAAGEKILSYPGTHVKKEM
jgi:hypothetical protein